MKTQPQRLLEEIIPLPEWVHEEWKQEIHNKWEIRSAGDHMAGILSEMTRRGGHNAMLTERAEVALARWEKLLNQPTQPVVQ